MADNPIVLSTNELDYDKTKRTPNHLIDKSLVMMCLSCRPSPTWWPCLLLLGLGLAVYLLLHPPDAAIPPIPSLAHHFY